ncbi:hypothetical protein [Nocardia sp. NPDC003726]
MLERVQLALAGSLGDVHGALGAVTGINEQVLRLAAELDQIVAAHGIDTYLIDRPAHFRDQLGKMLLNLLHPVGIRCMTELLQIIDGVADTAFQTAHFAAPLASLRPDQASMRGRVRPSTDSRPLLSADAWIRSKRRSSSARHSSGVLR